MALLLLILTIGLTYAGSYAVNIYGQANEPNANGSLTGATGSASAPRVAALESLSQPPPPPDAAALQSALARMNRPGPSLANAGQPTGPPPRSESGPQTSQAPSTATRFKDTVSSSVAPSGYSSNVNEPSVGNSGKYAFVTANWYAAKTSNLGGSPPVWTYVNPYTGFPTSPGSGFCCDQDVIYSISRDVFFWERMGVPDITGTNWFLITGIGGNLASTCTYSFTPGVSGIPSGWSGTWFDFPNHMTLSTNNLWLTFNMYNAANQWVRTVAFRFPIDPMAACAGFSYTFWATDTFGTGNNVFQMTPVQLPAQSGSRMYLGTHWSTSAMRIYYNDESSTTLFWLTPALGFTWNAGLPGHCPSPSAVNWCSFGDYRVQGGAVTRWADRGPTGSVSIVFFWDVAEGGSFTYPYIEAARFSTALVYQSRPLVWSSSYAFRYPGVAPNARGDVGLVMMVGTTTFYPSIAVTMFDEFIGTPPGWLFYIQDYGSKATTRMGDFLTTRPFGPSQYVWISAAYVLDSSGVGVTHVIVWGRGRDSGSVTRWWLV